MPYCSSCGEYIPEGQSSSCSMCYGDIEHGNDGYYRQWAEEQMRLEQERYEDEMREREEYECQQRQWEQEQYDAEMREQEQWEHERMMWEQHEWERQQREIDHDNEII